MFVRVASLVSAGVLLSGAFCVGALAQGHGSALSEEAMTETELAAHRAEMAGGGGHESSGGGGHETGLSEEVVPLLTDETAPKETQPIVEIGERFLNNGNLDAGITLPTGAVWQPALWVFGDFRAAAGHFDNGVAPSRQYQANQLNLFFNLKLTPTERVLIGFSPLTDGTDDTGILHTNGDTSFVNGLNPVPSTFFFEGEFGEIFPNLDPDENKGLDIGFAIGRQPLLFQDGVMINDTIDAIGITRDTVVIPGITQDMRITGIFGFSNINRDNNVLDEDAYLFGVFTETDLRKSTVDLDAAFVTSDNRQGGDALYLGASATQRFGLYNTTFSINSSTAFENEGAAADDGVLLFSQVSRTLPYSENIVYANAFWGIDNYSSAARGARAGGPLGRVGILFAAPAVGFAGPALSNRADDAFGGAIGHQMFFNHAKTQLTLEVGGRKDTNGIDRGAVAFGGQLLHALNNRSSVQVDASVSDGENQDIGSGVRMELRTRF